MNGFDPALGVAYRLRVSLVSGGGSEAYARFTSGNTKSLVT